MLRWGKDLSHPPVSVDAQRDKDLTIAPQVLMLNKKLSKTHSASVHAEKDKDLKIQSAQRPCSRTKGSNTHLAIVHAIQRQRIYSSLT
jgi:hypothetical protein